MRNRKIVLRQNSRIIHYPITNYEQFLGESKEFFRRHTIAFPNPVQVNRDKKINPVDFNFLKTIGIGTFGLVYLTALNLTGNHYAIKVLRKKTIQDANVTVFINRHRKYLEGINFPFCQGIICTFQDTGFLFLCQELMTGGDLFWHLSKQKMIYEPLAVFYGAQITLAIEYLHTIGLVHRNIKPENILMNSKGYLKLTGFTLSKKIRNSITYTMCGTPDYMAPEMIKQDGHSRAVDWWSFGVLIYELVAGFTPFRADDELGTMNNILRLRYTVCAHFTLGLQELLLELFKLQPLERMGMRFEGAQEVKKARWFQGMNWLSLANQELHAPFIPSCEKVYSNFPDMKPVEIIPPEVDRQGGLFPTF